MDKSPVVYKRRSGRPLSELPWNVSDVNADPDFVVSLVASDDEGIENVTPVKENTTPGKKSRKGWSDQPLPRKRTRSTTALGEALNPEDRASKSFGTLSKRKGKDKGKGVERSPAPRQAKDVGRPTPRKIAMVVEKTTPSKQPKDVGKTTSHKQAKVVERTTPRNHASEESPGGGHGVVLHSPIEFVREKQAMFAEIDAFELESEEEGPEEKKGKEKEIEIESLESSKGESAGPSHPMKPEQSTQEVASTEEVGEKDNG